MKMPLLLTQRRHTTKSCLAYLQLVAQCNGDPSLPEARAEDKEHRYSATYLARMGDAADPVTTICSPPQVACLYLPPPPPAPGPNRGDQQTPSPPQV